MNGEDLKQWWVNLIFLKYMQVRCSFIHVEHNSEYGILNEYHMSELNHFNVLLLCKMMW
jgi:hypothetical protein